MQVTTPTPATSPTLVPADPAASTRAMFETYLEAVSCCSGFGRYLHDDVTFTLFGGPEAKGRAAVEALITAIHSQAFDARLVVKRTICERHHAAAELVFAGTHIGEFAGVAATGRQVEVPYTAAYDFAVDGRVAAIRIYLPMHVLMGQLGV